MATKHGDRLHRLRHIITTHWEPLAKHRPLTHTVAKLCDRPLFFHDMSEDDILFWTRHFEELINAEKSKIQSDEQSV